jgi:hypothetical protein
VEALRDNEETAIVQYNPAPLFTLGYNAVGSELACIDTLFVPRRASEFTPVALALKQKGKFRLRDTLDPDIFYSLMTRPQSKITKLTLAPFQTGQFMSIVRKV